MSPQTFQEGDRVRVTDDDQHAFAIGSIGTVIEVLADEEPDPLYDVSIPGVSYTQVLTGEQLELA